MGHVVNSAILGLVFLGVVAIPNVRGWAIVLVGAVRHCGLRNHLLVPAARPAQRDERLIPPCRSAVGRDHRPPHVRSRAGATLEHAYGGCGPQAFRNKRTQGEKAVPGTRLVRGDASRRGEVELKSDATRAASAGTMPRTSSRSREVLAASAKKPICPFLRTLRTAAAVDQLR